MLLSFFDRFYMGLYTYFLPYGAVGFNLTNEI